jgi:hypothetical protein
VVQPGRYGAAGDGEDRADFVDPVTVEIVQSDHRAVLRMEATQRLFDQYPVYDGWIPRGKVLGIAEGNPSPDSSPSGKANGLVAGDPSQPRLGTNPIPKLVTMTKGLLKGILNGIGSIVSFLQNDQGETEQPLALSSIGRGPVNARRGFVAQEIRCPCVFHSALQYARSTHQFQNPLVGGPNLDRAPRKPPRPKSLWLERNDAPIKTLAALDVILGEKQRPANDLRLRTLAPSRIDQASLPWRMRVSANVPRHQEGIAEAAGLRQSFGTLESDNDVDAHRT